jgi:hypothetical protein
MTMTKQIIIALCGKKRCGKDTVANYIRDKYPEYNNLKISQQLKDIIKIIFDFNDDQIESDLKDAIDPIWNVTPRKTMQFVGTELMQYEIQKILPDIGRLFWIKSFINKNILNNNNKIIITDLRFLHEYEELKKYNAIIVKIEKNENQNEDSHPSELEYLKIPADYIINNEGSLDDLKNNVNKCLFEMYNSVFGI